jgi:hypothetical protein
MCFAPPLMPRVFGVSTLTIRKSKTNVVCGVLPFLQQHYLRLQLYILFFFGDYIPLY